MRLLATCLGILEALQGAVWWCCDFAVCWVDTPQCFCFAAPSALVVARLCAAGREQGRELLRLVRGARLAFHSGTLPASFTVETAGAGRAMQALLSHLQAMQAAVASHTDVEGAAYQRRVS